VISLKKIKSVKLKPKYLGVVKTIGVFLCLFLGLFLFYNKQIHDLTKVGYSKEASKKILLSFKKDYALTVGENKTLNKAFESTDFNEDYIDNYAKINYVDHEHLISNINKLLKIGYSNNDINIILSHGNDDSVTRFTKRDKIKYLEEFYTISYAKLDNYDRYVKYADETGEDEETAVLFVNLDMDKPDYEEAVPVDKFSPDMLVNKHHVLSEDFVPNDLVKIDGDYASDDMECSHIALNAYKEMSDAAKKDGYEIVINSAYRSYQEQVELNDYYLKQYGQDYADKYVAKPGYSEHQTGLAFDIGSRKVNVFANSKEYTWMQDNAYKYGFILRFTKKDENITGFRSEPWHYRYVGKKIAQYIHENNVTLEEYFVMFLDN